MYYAHSKEGTKENWQPLADHLRQTAELAYKFGLDAGVENLAKIAGRLHDIGKYSQAFQARLAGNPKRVDHASAGAQEIISLFPNSPQKDIALLLAYAIAGHHSGLPDGGTRLDVEDSGTLHSRLKKEIDEFSGYRDEINPIEIELPQSFTIHPQKGKENFSLSFLVRMIYSALVDADFQDTSNFMQGKKQRGEFADLETLNARLDKYLQNFKNNDSPINQKRNQTLQTCIDKSENLPGFFTLTLPTGGGKTLASLAFALRHAKIHGLKKIIYVIPFTSIIEQNAGVFRACLGAENVLEHHANFDWRKQLSFEALEDEENDLLSEKLRLATENWDIPVVVTTNVQFFESLFSNRSSRCRKIHNLAKSIMIFDEAQMLPREMLTPSMAALWELVTNYHSSVVFCTATQPVLQRFFPLETTFTELVPSTEALFTFYRRTNVTNLGRLSDDEILQHLNKERQTLCIVNTRRHAKSLLSGLEGKEGNYHLSTLMCPAHRQQTLEKVRGRLKSGDPCRVISTQVLEAGIDIDFPNGYRALAGLDSIMQAAGRVNREGKLPTANLFLFEPSSDLCAHLPKYIEQGAAVTREILQEEKDLLNPASIKKYFELLYDLQDPQHGFDSAEILNCFRSASFNFASASERFKVIGDEKQTLLIPFNDEANEWISQLRTEKIDQRLLRKLQLYSVNLYPNQFNLLNEGGKIDYIMDQIAILNDPSCYDPLTGINIPEKTGALAMIL